MNFYKRNIFFIALLQIIMILAILFITPDAFEPDGRSASLNARNTEDSTEYVVEKVKKSGEDKSTIHLKDDASPKTVNFILHLIYRLTFNNPN